MKVRNLAAKLTLNKCPNDVAVETYAASLRVYYGINAKLKKEGILAPAAKALENTKAMYKIMGNPLDGIPTIHVGGTNGKVRMSCLFSTEAFDFSFTLKNFSTGNYLFQAM
jgi:hypothetical protein